MCDLFVCVSNAQVYVVSRRGNKNSKQFHCIWMISIVRRCFHVVWDSNSCPNLVATTITKPKNARPLKLAAAVSADEHECQKKALDNSSPDDDSLFVGSDLLTL